MFNSGLRTLSKLDKCSPSLKIQTINFTQQILKFVCFKDILLFGMEKIIIYNNN